MLTCGEIDFLQSYYDQAIKEECGERRKQFGRYTFINYRLMCPSGSDSWCKSDQSNYTVRVYNLGKIGEVGFSS